MYKNVIFDADGTVINSFKDIAESLSWGLVRCGYPQPPEEMLRKFIGPSIYDSLTKIAGVPHEDTEAVITEYRAKYKETNHSGTVLYEGYPKLFERLKGAGVKLSMASSKPEKFLRDIFDKFGITHYFEKIVGAVGDGKSSDKSSIVKAAILDNDAIMVGDRKFDIIAATELGIDSIGVTYGFMEDGEFDVHKPTFIADTTDDIYNIVISGKQK